VAELAYAPAGGTDGAAGRGRLFAVWHNERRPTNPVGSVFADAALWSLDLDSGEERLAPVEGSWMGEGVDATEFSAYEPTIAVDDAGSVHVAYAHIVDEYELFYRFTVLPVDGAWSQPQRINPDDDPITGDARLVLDAQGRPVLFASNTHADGQGGSLLTYTLEGGTWSRVEVARDEEYGFNWVAPSAAAVSGDRYGLVFGRRDAPYTEGILYFLRY